MPGAKAKSITQDIQKIKDLSDEVSRWSSKLAGVDINKSDWQVLFEHLTGIGHLEVLTLPAQIKKKVTDTEVNVKSLHTSLFALHAREKIILMKEDLLSQQKGVKDWAKAAYEKVKAWKDSTKIILPAANPPVDEKYKVVKGLAA
jgi:hypothetical protein